MLKVFKKLDIIMSYKIRFYRGVLSKNFVH